jgi:hypothetical protein
MVVMDADTLVVTADTVDITGLLLGMLLHEELGVYRYADAGPPAGTPSTDSEYYPSASIGWLVATPDEKPDGFRSHGLTYSDGHHVSRRALVGELIEHVSRKIAGTNDAPVTDRADAILTLAASEIGADILITNRPALLRTRPQGMTGSLTIVSTSEALPLIGLYLRSRGEYIVSKAPEVTVLYNKGLFWEEAARLHVANSREVLARSFMLDVARNTEELGALTYAALRRMARSFERRDSIWRLIDQHQDRDIAEDTLSALDSFLLFLMGAADALARMTHGILQLEVKGGPASIGWQKKDWLKAVKARAPKLAALLGQGSRESDAIEVLRLLRNTIHAEGLDAVSLAPSARVALTWVRLPKIDGTEIAAAIDRLGTRDDWGLHVSNNDRYFIEVGPLVENVMLEMLTVFRGIFVCLEEILRAITDDPPPPESSTLNEDLMALHLQWQVGLGKPWADLPWVGTG